MFACLGSRSDRITASYPSGTPPRQIPVAHETTTNPGVPINKSLRRPSRSPRLPMVIRKTAIMNPSISASWSNWAGDGRKDALMLEMPTSRAVMSVRYTKAGRVRTE